MASEAKKKNNWFLACFGISRRLGSEKKGGKCSRRRRLFKLCMPRIKVIVIMKKKVKFDAKAIAIKATTQSMILLEATKVQQHKLKHGSITKERNSELTKSNDQNDDLQSPTDIPNVTMQESTTVTPTATTSKPTVDKYFHNNKDSLAGVSILVITLMIISIWGRLSAVLCMSAWLYFLPILKMYKDVAGPKLSKIKIDMTTKLRKKKAVLKGLRLRRDNMIGIGVS